MSLAARRAGGLDFDDAWPIALAATLSGSGADRGAWRKALEATAPSWRAAYGREAETAGERALVRARELSGRDVALTRAEVRAAKREEREVRAA